MALFSAQQKKQLHILQYLPVLLLVLAIALLIVSANSLTESGSSREEEIVSSALERSITQCYALEGAYPPDLDYLQTHYGFTYNREHFFIDYQYIGGNLRPNITIIKKEAKD